MRGVGCAIRSASCLRRPVIDLAEPDGRERLGPRVV